MRLRGCGFRSPFRTVAACWASWADSLRMMRHPATLSHPHHLRHLLAAATCRAQLLHLGFAAPQWKALAKARRRLCDATEPCVPVHCWLHHARTALEDSFVRGAVVPRFALAQRALVRSHGCFFSGLLVAVLLTSCLAVRPSPLPGPDLAPSLASFPLSLSNLLVGVAVSLTSLATALAACWISGEGWRRPLHNIDLRPTSANWVVLLAISSSSGALSKPMTRRLSVTRSSES